MNRAAIALGEAFDLFAAALDRAYYVRQFPSLKGTTINAAQHYLLYGWRRGLEPSPDFSSAYYLERSPDVAASGMIPFHHYLGWGRHEGRLGAPGPVSLNGPKLNENQLLVGAEFDRTFYLDNHPELEETHVDPLLHFMAFGWRQGFDPTPDFSIEFYLERSPDVRASGVNPFEHYLRYGRREGRAPTPDAVGQRRPLSPAECVLSAEFDPDFYLMAYPELATMNVDPLLHFLSFGWRQGKDPNAAFSTRFYLERSPDVAETDVNPFQHWLEIGRARGRVPRNPDPEGLETDFQHGPLVRTVVSAALDAPFYRTAYPERDIDDPVEDYLAGGWRLGRDPTPAFSSRDYLQRYPDVEPSGFNPFFHYLAWGRSEGLVPFEPHTGQAPAVLRPGHAFRDPQLHAAWGEARTGRKASAPVDLNPRRLNVHWVIPDLEGPGRGGHMTLFRMVRWLELFGHRCTLWINDPDVSRSMDERTDLLLRGYQVVRAELRLLPDQPTFPDDALVIATSWDTAHRVEAAQGGAARFYFVQDYEPYFYPAGARSLAAEQTYDFDLGFICAGRWLERRLRERGRWVTSFELAPEERGAAVVGETNPVPRIVLYARQHTERRMYELGVMALERLAESGVAFHAELFGADVGLTAAPFPVTSHGVITPDALPALFSRCDVGLCLSATNYSLVPQEMMACGLPVVELDGENTRSVFPEGTVTLAAGQPSAIADALALLLRDPERRREQIERASAWTSTLSWERSARVVEAALIAGAEHQGASLPIPPVSMKASAPLASVIIPTLNGGDLFKTVLDRVLEQRTNWPFEVLVIDSESTDGTWEHLLGLGSRVRAWRTPRARFQHGRTRNEAVAVARGRYVALLTQDALPADSFWLYDLVESLRRRPRAAGAFGRHLARPDASPFTRRDIEDAFAGLEQRPLEVSRFLDPERWASEDADHRRFLHFFSDNNACLRRSVWRRRPYPEVDFGEDQLWAAQVVAEGYTKVYVPSARVIHSHDYDEGERFERARVEAAFLLEAFGYDRSPADMTDRLRRMDVGDQVWGVRHGVSADEIARKQRLNAQELLGAAAGVAEAKARARPPA